MFHVVCSRRPIVLSTTMENAIDPRTQAGLAARLGGAVSRPADITSIEHFCLIFVRLRLRSPSTQVIEPQQWLASEKGEPLSIVIAGRRMNTCTMYE